MYVIHVEPAVGAGFTEEHHDEDAVAGAIQRLLYGPFARIKGIKGFKVVDTRDDAVIYEVRDNAVVFPSERDLEAMGIA